MKTVQQMINSSPEYEARAIQALNETEALLKKELSYLPHLQNDETVKSYTAHIAKLKGLING